MLRVILIVLVWVIAGCNSNKRDDRSALLGGNGSVFYPGGAVPSSAKEENPFIDVREKDDSTFGVDVDTAAYTYARAQINAGRKPEQNELRTEEFVNYFDYNYPDPGGLAPVGFHYEVGDAPWNPANRLIKIGMKAKTIQAKDVPPLNLVFLIDVSGSMYGGNRLPLVKEALNLLATQLRPQDKVSIVTYNWTIKVLLEAASGADTGKIKAVTDSLAADGGTMGGPGIQTAYDIALKHFIKGGVNRVILSTDGDFNIGMSDTAQLKAYVETQAKKGVAITIHGYGMGNFKDHRLETIADNGNGNYAYIDYLAEADKAFRMQLLGTLVIVAKDVKLQLKFNPVTVKSYRLIGYENRLMTGADFSDDMKDAGDMGSGHTVTAFYEIVPIPWHEDMKNKLFDLSVRYKEPESDTSQLIQSVAYDLGKTLAQTSDDFRFAAAAAWFAMTLGYSQYIGTGPDLAGIEQLADAARGADALGYRQEFVGLVRKSKTLPLCMPCPTDGQVNCLGLCWP